MNKQAERLLLKRLRKAGLHCEGVALIAVLQFPVGSVGLYDIYGTPLDDFEALETLLKTDEFITFVPPEPDYTVAIWLHELDTILKVKKS